MQKKLILFLIINIIALFMPLFNVYATDYQTGITTASDCVYVRKSASASAESTACYTFGTSVTIYETVTNEDPLCTSWYSISENNDMYVCAAYVLLNDDTYDYETELAKFPQSYQTILAKVHQKYSNAVFIAQNININFDTVVNNENTSSGRSLLWSTGSYNDGLKSTESWAYNWATNVFKNNYSGGGSYWYAPSKETIAYYLDPRNFLNSNSIFMFLNLSYDSKFHTLDGIKTILNGTFMSNKTIDNTTMTYADAFLAIAKETGVNPYFLAARVIQEQGSGGTSPLISGTYSGYIGYYNFYNIGAYGSTTAATITSGLSYAKDNGWNSIYKALKGGATFIGGSYISAGQDTLYLQKWHVIPVSGWYLYTHQYMQNISAPATESLNIYDAYSSSGILNTQILFKIPVYNNMSESNYSLPNSGNPNNYLSDLKVDGTTIENFSGATTNYEMEVDASVTSLNISATKVYSGATITGTGTKDLIAGEQNMNVIVTALNGNTRTYTIKVTKAEDKEYTLTEIKEKINYNYDEENGYLTKMNPATDVNTFIKNISSFTSYAEIAITDKNGVTKEGNIGTGDIIKIKSMGEEAAYNVIIYGDVNGDGKISASDYVLVKNHIMNTSELSGLNLISANPNKDESISASDYVIIKNHIMGKSLINQE